MSGYRWTGVLVLIADGVPSRHGLGWRRDDVVVPVAPVPVTLGFDVAPFEVPVLGRATLRWQGIVDLVADLRLTMGDPNVERLLRADLGRVWPCLAYTEHASGFARRLSVDAVALCTGENADARVRAIGAA